MIERLWRQLLVLCLAVGFAAGLLSGPMGCAGYQAGGGYQGDIRTASVNMFANQTYEIGLEAQLNEAITKEIQRATPWRVVSSGVADAVLTGSITESRLESISVDSATGLTEELGVRITVSFEWRDQRSGRPLVQREQFSAMGTFVPAQGIGQRIETGRRGAVQELARDIVDLLRSDW